MILPRYRPVGVRLLENRFLVFTFACDVLGRVGIRWGVAPTEKMLSSILALNLERWFVSTVTKKSSSLLVFPPFF